MKIISAFIDDPTERGQVDFPQLCVVVDQLPDVTIEPANFAGGWTVGKYGPFVKYSCSESDVDAGDFNVRFRDRFSVVVDITLHLESGIGYTGYCLPLTRARQLVRKYCTDWRILINDHAGEKGSLLWLPVQLNPTCRMQVGNKPCGNSPARFIRISEVDVAMCDRHVQDHNERYAAKRTAARAS